MTDEERFSLLTSVMGTNSVITTGSDGLDEAYAPFFGAFAAAWDDAMVARWSANPLGMLWPEMDAALVTSGGGNVGPPAAAPRPVVVVAAG